MSALPNFFLLGPPKCGTTAIVAELARHPEVFISEPKEPNYFVYQGGNPYCWDPLGKDSLKWYEGIFANAVGTTAVGDASPYYICCHHVAAEIRHYNPNAKLIAVLRNPVYRAFSMYRYWNSGSETELSTEDFVHKFHSEGLFRNFELSVTHRVGWLKETGFYYRHLDRYRKAFPAEQLQVLFYSDLVTDPNDFYRHIFQFLEVDAEEVQIRNEIINRTVEPRFRMLNSLINRPGTNPVGQFLKRSFLRKPLRGVRPILNRINQRDARRELSFPKERYEELIKPYLRDIEELETFCQRDLSGWRDGSMQ